MGSLVIVVFYVLNTLLVVLSIHVFIKNKGRIILLLLLLFLFLLARRLILRQVVQVK